MKSLTEAQLAQLLDEAYQTGFGHGHASARNRDTLSVEEAKHRDQFNASVWEECKQQKIESV